ncbi:MAG: 2Fe-2S iron-sulfur cluster binding domain-containing protein [Saprospiraceae bacterium]|nr:2Fe-2S iron-sulfur cluster binding domain-containing protein [Saprospiraceae bacterium]
MKKVNFYIDGVKYEGYDGQNLVEAAREQGINIPSLCYYPHIDPPLATCRVCTVKVDGKPAAGCICKVKEGTKVEFNSEELKDNRKAVVEMMFAEGNHFCPACEKSGDCDLQHLGYDSGLTSTRFPHLFIDRVMDFNPKRMVIEPNRCVKCMRCVEEVVTDDGKKVFSFRNRGNESIVSIDYDLESKLTEEEALRAMHICPVGAILVRGKSLARPFGDRKYDDLDSVQTVPLKEILTPSSAEGKKTVATASLAGCFGCHMSMLDIDLGILDVIDLVEFNKSPLNDIKTFTKRCDIGLIEGGCCNSENVEALLKFREMCDVLVSVGECAIWGGLPAMRNTVPLKECLEESYINSITSENNEQLIPAHEDIPKILDRVYSCHEIVKIDYWIPGCPPSADHIWKVVKNLLFNQDFSVLYPEFKYD